MKSLPKIKLDKKLRNLLTILLFAIILLELVWACNYSSKPATVPTGQEEVVVPEASLALSPSAGTFTAGENFEVQIVLQAEDTITTDGVDVTISFDPQKLEVLDVSSLGFYPQRLLNTVDSEAGAIRLALANTPNQEKIKGGGVVATITFQTLQAGETEVIFGTSTVAQNGLNILSQTTGGSYTIE